MEGYFDVVILGTGLTESITAAALSKAGFKIAQIDTNSYYGADDATLTLDELITWADKYASHGRLPETIPAGIPSPHARFTGISRSQGIPTQPRQYSISLSPSIIPSVGPLISSLVSSGVARYGGFRLLERVDVYDRTGMTKKVPGSKEDVFKDKEISLVDKRRLMRFLMFATGEFEGKGVLESHEDAPFVDFLKTTFSLPDDVAMNIAYSLGYCMSATDPTLPALQRIRRYLRSAGRYGASPFIVGHYGGSGEIAQGFCRTAAVSGGVYILGRCITSITASGQHQDQLDRLSPVHRDPYPSLPNYTIELEGFPDRLTCGMIISSSSYIPPQLSSKAKYVFPSTIDNLHQNLWTARCIAIIDKPIQYSMPMSNVVVDHPSEETPIEQPLRQQVDTSVIVFPPGSVEGGSTSVVVTALITGEGTMSAPKGRWVVYLSLPSHEQATSSEFLLKPYLDAILRLTTPYSIEPSSNNTSTTESLFSLFYMERNSPAIDDSRLNNSLSTFLIAPSPTPLLPEFSDAAATNAETVFWEAVNVLKTLPQQANHRQTDRMNNESANEDERPAGEVERFWPLLDENVDDDTDESW